MMNFSDEYDNVFHERINVLLDQGYLGFTVDKITGSKESGEFIVAATNHKGANLTAKGETKEEACKKMIDLIDIHAEEQKTP